MNVLSLGRCRRSRAAVTALCCVLLLTACSGRRSEQYRQEGDQYYELAKYEEAGKSYQSSLSLNPENALALLGKGRVLQQEKDREGALKAFAEARKIDPSLTDAYGEAIQLYLPPVDTEKPEPPSDADKAEAEKIAKQFQTANPESGATLLAYVYLRTNRPAEAVTLLQNEKDKQPASSEIRIALSKALLEVNQPVQAEAELNELLKAKPEDEVSVRLALVDVYEATQKLEAAEAELRGLTSANPDNLKLKILLAVTLLKRGSAEANPNVESPADTQRLDEARKLADEVLAQAPDNGSANFVAGSSLVAKGQLKEAVPFLEKAVQASPEKDEYKSKLDFAKSGGKGSLSAEPKVAPIEAAPTTLPLSSDSNKATWQALWTSGSLSTLVQERESLLKDNPADDQLKQAVTMAAIFTGQLPVAEALSQSLPSDSPIPAYLTALKARDFKSVLDALKPWKPAEKEQENAEPRTKQDKQKAAPTVEQVVAYNNLLGYALSLSGFRLVALKMFSEAAKAMPDEIVSLYNMAVMYQMAAMPEFAAAALQKLLNQHPENVEARRMLFKVLMADGKEREAGILADSSYGLYPKNRETILSLVEAYVSSGKTDWAYQALDKALKEQPDDLQLTLTMANVLLYLGKGQDAQARIESLSGGLPASLQAQRLQYLAFAMAQQDNWEGVGKLLSASELPNLTSPARLLLMASQIRAGRTADALATMRSSSGALPPGSNAVVLARALGEETAVTEEQEKLAAALKSQPEALATFAYGLASSEVGFGRIAYEAFGKVVNLVGVHPRLVTLELTALSKAKDIQDRVKAAQAIVDKNTALAEAWVGLGLVKEEANDIDGARAALDKAVELEGTTPEVWYRRSLFGEKHKNFAMALEASRHLVELIPDNASLRNNYAYYLLETNGDTQEALKQAQLAHEKLKDHPNVLHTLGLAQLRAGDFARASENLRKAVELRPGDPTLLLDYGNVLIKTGREPEGKQQIQSALQFSKMLNIDFPRKDEAEKLVPPAPAGS